MGTEWLSCSAGQTIGPASAQNLPLRAGALMPVTVSPMLLAEEQSQYNGHKQENGEENHEEIKAHLFPLHCKAMKA